MRDGVQAFYFPGHTNVDGSHPGVDTHKSNAGQYTDEFSSLSNAFACWDDTRASDGVCEKCRRFGGGGDLHIDRDRQTGANSGDELEYTLQKITKISRKATVYHKHVRREAVENSSTWIGIHPSQWSPQDGMNHPLKQDPRSFQAYRSHCDGPADLEWSCQYVAVIRSAKGDESGAEISYQISRAQTATAQEAWQQGA